MSYTDLCSLINSCRRHTPCAVTHRVRWQLNLGGESDLYSQIKMNERDSEELSRQLKNSEFLELDRQLSVLHGKLLLSNVKAVYVPDDGRSPGGNRKFIAFNPGWDEQNLNRFLSEFLKDVEKIAWQMAGFFPKTRRLDWKERFIAFAVLGDYNAIPTRDIFFVIAHLSDTEEKKFLELERKYGNDKTAKAILSSFNEATNDPDNELVHLYEIWEALTSKFGGEKNALSELNISQRERVTLTKLANNEPLRQGRHRGKHIEGLRDATSGELEAVRKIAARMIYAYFNYLDCATSTVSNDN